MLGGMDAMYRRARSMIDIFMGALVAPDLKIP
jgi:hypothetical protein